MNTVDKLASLKVDFARELGSIVEKYTEKMLDVIRQTSIADLAENGPLTSRGDLASGSSNGTDSMSEYSPVSGNKRGRRSMETLITKIVEVLHKHPEGMLTHQLRDELGLKQERFHQAIQIALNKSLVSKSGIRRGSVYSLTAPPVGENAA